MVEFVKLGNETFPIWESSDGWKNLTIQCRPIGSISEIQGLEEVKGLRELVLVGCEIKEISGFISLGIDINNH